MAEKWMFNADTTQATMNICGDEVLRWHRVGLGGGEGVFGHIAKKNACFADLKVATPDPQTHDHLSEAAAVADDQAVRGEDHYREGGAGS